MSLAQIQRVARNSKRFQEIAKVFAKYGLADWLKDSPPEWIRNLLRTSEGVRLSELSSEERWRIAFTELGTTFIKLGQMLSTRADLIGEEFARELKKLQSNTPADDAETVRKTIEAELGKPPEELFASFEAEAIASASIGQVHEATLRDGRQVVVKVQHDGIEPRVQRDLEILMMIAELAEEHSAEARLYRPRTFADEFRRSLLPELDFRRELRNLQEFGRNFADDATIHIPEPFADLSSHRVLTMEKLEGFSVADTGRSEAEGVDTTEFARRGASLYIEMVFRDGFYHADPHPGNLWVLPGGVLGLLDCGMVGRLDDQTREEFEGLLLAAVDKDAERIVDYLVRVGSTSGSVDRRRLQAQIGEILAEYGQQSLDDFDLSGSIGAITDVIREHRVSLPPGVSQLLKVLVMLEGTARLLSPDFNIAELIQPYYVRIAMRRFSPQRIAAKMRRAWRDWDHLLTILPRSLSDALTRARTGSFEVHLVHERLEATVNRLVYGIVLAAVVLASALLLAQRVPPRVGDVSILGLLGVLVALYLGWRLLRAIHRSGDLG